MRIERVALPWRSVGRTITCPEARFPRTAFARDLQAMLRLGLAFGDAVVIVASGMAGYAALHQVSWPPLDIVVVMLLSAAMLPCTLRAMTNSGARPRRLAERPEAAVFSCLTLIAISAFVVARWLQGENPAWTVLWASLAVTGFGAMRIGMRQFLPHLGLGERLNRRIAVIGQTATIARAIGHLLNADWAVRIAGIMDLGASPSEMTCDDLLEMVRRERIEEVVIGCPSNEAFTRDVIKRLAFAPIDVTLFYDLRRLAPDGAFSLGQPLVRVVERPMGGWRSVVKRAMDLTLAGALAAVLGPGMAIIAVLIRLDSPGPILFRQTRSGLGQRPITVYKFRTMIAEAGDDPLVRQARRNDSRVTRIGRLLRRTSLDELPQLISVLQGTMSLVGPRPHAVSHDRHYAELIDGYAARFRVKPGITGLAQVNGFRGEIDTPEKMTARLQYDLWYIDHWSPLLDVKILLKTIFAPFHGNAY